MRKVLALSLCCLTAALTVPAGAAERIPVPGAAQSAAVTQLFFRHFSRSPAASGYRFQVEARTMGHTDAIRATEDHLFGRAARPLSQGEKRQNKAELLLAHVPLVFAVGSDTGVSRLTLDQIADIYSRHIRNWKEVGGTDAEIVLAGREPGEPLFDELRRDHPVFRRAAFDYVFLDGLQLADFIQSERGRHAIAFGPRTDFEQAHLLAVKDLDSGLDLGLIYDHHNSDHPLVEAARQYARSAAWYDVLQANGLRPVLAPTP